MTMVREGRVGKGYRRDWPSFLNKVVTEQVWQTFAEEQGRSATLDRRLQGESDGHRGRADQRWTAKFVVLTWVMMGWLRSPILGERFTESWNVLARLYWRRRRAGRQGGLCEVSQSGIALRHGRGLRCQHRRKRPCRRDRSRLGWRLPTQGDGAGAIRQLVAGCGSKPAGGCR